MNCFRWHTVCNLYSIYQVRAKPVLAIRIVTAGRSEITGCHVILSTRIFGTGCFNRTQYLHIYVVLFCACMCIGLTIKSVLAV